MSNYYVDAAERLPLSTLTKAMAQAIPWPVAAIFAGTFKLKNALGFPLRALNGLRWNPDFEWQRRDQMPAAASSRWAAHLEQLQDLDFEICGYVKSETIGNKQDAICFLRHTWGVTTAQIVWQQIAAKETVRLSLISYLPDGRELMTTALSPVELLVADILTPEYINLYIEPDGTPLAILYERHISRPEITEALILTKEGFLEQYRRQRVKFFNHCRQTGIIRPLTQREIKRLTNVRPAV